MKLIAIGVVTGFTQFAGEIDGQKIDSNTVFIEADIGLESGQGKRTVDRKCADAKVLERIKSMPLPFEAEIEMTQIASRSKEQSVIVNIKPRVAQKAA